ncbi:transposase [Atopobacter phocae]|uniref:transposase n=1 Tax=Atopobacter phocae TaxID=136492 RepID=UPI0004712477
MNNLKKVKEKLLSPKGRKLFSKRKIDLEPVFGQIKAYLGYTRCHLRVKKEMELVLMANNIKKTQKLFKINKRIITGDECRINDSLIFIIRDLLSQSLLSSIFYLINMIVYLIKIQ